MNCVFFSGDIFMEIFFSKLTASPPRYTAYLFSMDGSVASSWAAIHSLSQLEGRFQIAPASVNGYVG